MPSLSWLASWHLLPPALLTVPSTILGSHIFPPSMGPTGSRGIFLPSSSEVSGDPPRKEATIAFSSGGSSKSEPPPSDPSSSDCVLGLADWPETGWSLNWTVQCLLFPPSQLCHWWSLLLGRPLDCEWAQVQFSLSISFSRANMLANAFWCASCTVARLLATESFFLVQ